MSQFQKPPRVEPLSELSWRRVENQVFAALDRGADQPLPAEASPSETARRRWPAAAAVLACAAAVALVFVLRELPTGEPQTLRTSRIVTTAAASELSIGDADITVEPASALWVASQGDRVEIVLERGSVDCAVAPRRERPPFVVRAGDIRVEVIGTAFAVTRHGDSARVEVFEGVVQVMGKGDVARVRAGESWPPHLAVKDEAAEGEDRAVERADRQRKRKRHRAHEHRARRPERDAGEREVRRSEVDDAPSDQELYETAARLEASDADAAIAIYRRLAASSGPWSATALFAQARLESDRGRTEVAVRLLHRYLERHPSGSNAADARLLLQDLEGTP